MTDNALPVAQSTAHPAQHATAFYDGGCPVCRVEVKHYQGIGGGAVEWVDICTLGDVELAVLADGHTRHELLGAMHVRDGSGWHVGVDAFPAIWRRMPGWRRMAWVFSVPGVKPVARLGYRAFLAWQRWHRKRRAG
jgi:predicted DCC family thiol-disulfide oxidoreductase YuxK